MHGHTNWKYAIDVTPCTHQVLQDTHELFSIGEINRILDVADETFEEEALSMEEEIYYSSTSIYGSSTSDSSSESIFLDT